MAKVQDQKKTVVITGGATGIGFETARMLLETGGFRTILIGRRKARMEEAAHNLGSHAENVRILTCDLQDPSQISQTAEKILATTPAGLYGLVNNAGMYPFGGLKNTSVAAWDQTMAVNLRSAFLLTQALASAIAKNPVGGRIVNVSSTAGILPNHFALAYTVSKAGLIQLSKTLAKELGKDNITVNCVCPGIVRTPLHETYHESARALEDFYAKKGASYPLGRVGEPQDVAAAIVFFLGEAAGWITGEVCVVDGGRLLT